MVSVIMSTYNESRKELFESIESILNQTYRNFEFIIINDNPENKELKATLIEFQDKDRRIRLVNNSRNLGLAECLNIGLDLAKGDYLARMDADDICFPERLEKQVYYLDKHYGCAMVASNRLDINENSEEMGTCTRFNIKDEDLKKIMLHGSVIIHPSVMIRKDVIKKMNGYRLLRAGQDYDLWLRMLTDGYTIHIMPDILLKYRIRNNSISRANFTKQFFATQYAIYCYKQRKSGIDESLTKTFEEFLSDTGKNNEEKNKKLNCIYLKINEALRNGNYIDVLKILPKLFKYPEIVAYYTRGIRYKCALRRYSKPMGELL